MYWEYFKGSYKCVHCISSAILIHLSRFSHGRIAQIDHWRAIKYQPIDQSVFISITSRVCYSVQYSLTSYCACVTRCSIYQKPSMFKAGWMTRSNNWTKKMLVEMRKWLINCSPSTRSIKCCNSRCILAHHISYKYSSILLKYTSAHVFPSLIMTLCSLNKCPQSKSP